MPREPLVHERVVGRRAAPAAGWSSRSTLREQHLGLACGTHCAGCRRSPGTAADRADARLEVAQLQPLADEVLDERMRRWSATMRRTCAFSTLASCNRPFSASVEQLIVRNARPEEERQPRRELEVADPVVRSRPARREHRSRRGTGTTGSRASAPRQRGCRVEVAAVRARVVVERHQRREMSSSVDRPTISSLRASGEDLLGARLLFRGCRGMADEEPSADSASR